MLSNYEEYVIKAQGVLNLIFKSISEDFNNKELHDVEEIGHSCFGAFIAEKGSGKDIKVEIPYRKL